MLQVVLPVASPTICNCVTGARDRNLDETKEGCVPKLCPYLSDVMASAKDARGRRKPMEKKRGPSNCFEREIRLIGTDCTYHFCVLNLS